MTEKVSQTAKAVMKKIKKQEVKMKPRAYFVLGSMLMGAGIVGVLILTAMLSGAIFFHLRMQGPVGFLRFGLPGLRFFARLFPWKMAGLSLVGLVGGSWLLKKHGKGYKVGIGWLVLGAVATVVGLGFLLDRVGVNERVRELKPVRPLYQIRFRDEDWLIGEIAEIEEERMVVVTPEGEREEVKLTEETRKPLKMELKVGDKVRVIGEKADGVFEAKGIAPGGLDWDSPAPMGSEMGPGMGPDVNPGMGPGRGQGTRGVK